MSDSDEESVVSARRSYYHRNDIFRKHAPCEPVEDDKEEEDETKDMEEGENEDDEEDAASGTRALQN